MGRLSRRAVSVLALAAFALAACQQQKAAAPVTADEMSMGNPSAKVTVIEYASAGCPFCARFNNEIFPAFKKQYVDTGKVRYVFREVLVGGGPEMAMGAGGFVLARCFGPAKYFTVLDQVFHAQADIYQSGDVKGGLLKVAKANGMNDKQFDACINNNDALVGVNNRSEKAGQAGVDVTPTFFINGKKAFEEVPTEAQLGAAVQAAGA